MKKALLLLLPITLFFGCSNKGTLNMQAGIIYKIGGNQPVGRVEFHLLDESLEKILLDCGIKPKKDSTAVSEYALSVAFPDSKESILGQAKICLMPHIKETVTTDFDGKAKFQAVKAGKYFVMGATSTRGGYVIWNLPVEIKVGENSIILGPDNAAIIF